MDAKIIASTMLQHLRDVSLHFVEMLPERFYFATVTETNLALFLKRTDNGTAAANADAISFLHFDKDLLYEPFNHDFGPLNLAMLCKYCKIINTHLQLRNKIVVHLTTTNRFKRANAAYLFGSYCIIYQQLHPVMVVTRLQELSHGYLPYKTFTPFVDAGLDTSDHHLQLEDCFYSVHKALHTAIMPDMARFNVDEYLFYEKVENGDLNWIVPGKMVAFCDPQTYSESAAQAVKLYVGYFRKHNITTVIRLNKSAYSSRLFTDKGFRHHDLVFVDGGLPPDQILLQFLRITGRAPGAVAVHCKAGLGRTGTLIACYLMWQFRFTAQEAVAWVRICRPGSIVGNQQRWLQTVQNFLWNFKLTDEDQCNNNNLESVAVNPQQQQQQLDANNNHGDGGGPDDANVPDQSAISMVRCRILAPMKDATLPVVAGPAIRNAGPIAPGAIVYVENVALPVPPRSPQKIVRSVPECYGNDDASAAAEPPIPDEPKFTQGDYLNQIKLNRRKRHYHLRSRLSLWFNKAKHNPVSGSQPPPPAPSLQSLDANNNSNNVLMVESSPLVMAEGAIGQTLPGGKVIRQNPNHRKPVVFFP